VSRKTSCPSMKRT